MIYEKSCGAVIFRNRDGGREYFLLLNKKGNAMGHWGFPKGHVEDGETEYETAAREIFEETGLLVVFCGHKRVVSNYSPKSGVNKDVVYFLATPRNDVKVRLQKEEVAEYRWCNAKQARELLNFDTKILDEMEKSF
ncbi:MAG: NUDIX domain-containing protein [Clostridia bacterium]|nr:NUDIX domain-containing protein [Clostridia bacterium]